MAAEIVHDDNIAWPEGGRELGFDIDIEDRPVHWRVNDPRGNEAVAFEACHKGLRPPMAKGGFAVQPLALQGAPAQPYHLCRGSGFINEDQPVALAAHDGLAAFFPFGPRLGQLRPVLFACPKGFFYS